MRRPLGGDHPGRHPGGRQLLGQPVRLRLGLRPGGDVQEQSLLQVFLYAAMWGFNAQQAVEAPRFQTEHLVASFDNHAMGPGTLLLDERTPPASISELQKRKHLIEMRSRYASGSAPVLVRLLPTGLLEAGADPFYYRASQAW